MRSTPVLAVAAIALVLVSVACSGGSAPSPSAQSPTAVPSSSSGGGGSAVASPTVAPSGKAAATAVTKSSPPTSSAGGDLEKVSMPSGSSYDPYKPVKIGDVVDLPGSSLVFQATGAKTVELDAQRDLLLVDLIIGNKFKEEVPISSVLMMAAVTSDWHVYSLGLDDLMATTGKSVALKMSELNVRSFDVGLKPNEARKGTAVIPIPKDAKGLGFIFYPTNLAAGMGSPTVYVGLGIKGEFPHPIIPEDVQALKAGTVYKIGQAVKAPKREVAIQVNGALERTQSLPKMEINMADKLVIVDITTRLFGSANAPSGNELRLMDSAGKYFRSETGNSNLVIQAENGSAYMADRRRGHLVFSGPRDAKGLKLVFTPSTGEKIEFDLGTLASTSAGQAVAAPKLVDTSVLPDELKSLPVPAGFRVVDGSVQRQTSGGKFESADAQLFGKTSLKDLSTFYKMQLAAQWESVDESLTTGELSLSYMNRKDDSLNLYVNAEQTDIGTTVDLRVEKY